MSYDPARQNKTELFTAWNSANQSLPSKTSGSTEQLFNITLTLDTIGEGDITLSSSVVTLPEDGFYAFFTGDVRSTHPASVSGDLYEIHFNQNDGDLSSGGQIHRLNRQDDQCYAIASSGELKFGYAFRSGGNTIAPWVRVLGVLIEE